MSQKEKHFHDHTEAKRMSQKVEESNDDTENEYNEDK